MKKFFFGLLIFASLIVLLLFGAFFTFKQHNVVAEKEIDIYDGASVKQIAELLENYGVVKNGNVFYYYIRLKSLYHEKVKKEPLEILFKQGHYEIKTGDFDSLISALNAGPDTKKAATTLTVPEGSSILDIAEIVAKNELFPKETFLTYVQDKNVYQKYQETYKWLPVFDERRFFPFEGYLHANTYNLPQNPTVEIVVEMMLDETNSWFEKSKEQLTKLNLSFEQAMTLASVVEGESKFKEDRPKVARVFLNRIEQDMKLESDMTAAYANQEHKVFMYNKDIQTASPYNTYHVKGLPLGPINAPSKESFDAVLQPAEKSFKALYFYARPSGETFYAEKWEQHEQNRLKWEHEWKALEKKS